MKVKELIKKLEGCNPEAIVVVKDYDGCNHEFIETLCIRYRTLLDMPKYMQNWKKKPPAFISIDWN